MSPAGDRAKPLVVRIPPAVGGSPIPTPPQQGGPMAVVLPFRLPAHAPPEKSFSPPAELLETQQLPLSAADRECLLAALEMALAVCGGNGGAARRLALAYSCTL